MKKYWLLLEAYVFIWKNKSNVLIYNALSGEYINISIGEILKDIIEQLLDEQNLYCIEITEKDICHSEVREFIKLLQEQYMGDLYDQSQFPQKPLVVIPSASVNEDMNNTIENTDNLELLGRKIMNNLQTVSIYLTGECANTCQYCNEICKQTIWCKKNSSILDRTLVDAIFKQLEDAHIPVVQFLGGDLFSYPNFNDLLLSLNNYTFNKYFYVNYRHAFNNPQFIKSFNNNIDFHIRFLIDPYITEAEIDKCLSLDRKRVEYIFIIFSIDDFKLANTIIDKYQLESSIIPLYDFNNLSFFEEFIYINKEDFSSFHRNKKEIFANQRVNSNFFGRLFIDSDCKVYSNINTKPIGNAKQKISELVFKEIKDGKVWLQTRDSLPICKDCLFRYLCPSPSNYELVIGKPNLCHVKP